ncbi:serine/threonine-protein kinase fray2-like, partial [Aphis craccivora]
INNKIKHNEEVQIVNTIITQDREKIYDKAGTQIKISNNLTTDQHNQTIKLLKQFIHIFSTDTINIKPANVQPCQIQIKPNSKEPKFNPPHRISPSQRQELKTQLDKLITANIVKHTKSNFASPAFLVKKKEKNNYRLVVSYKDLNNIIES